MRQRLHRRPLYFGLELKARRLISRLGTAAHTVQVTSFGGCGTTMLQRFLQEHGRDVPGSLDAMPWKHARVPPASHKVKDGFRACYLFANPMDAVLSVFRRGFQHWHIQRMQGDLSQWKWDWELEDFLRCRTDFFRLGEHFTNWTTAERDYPILLLRFETLWEYLPEVFEFLELPYDLMEQFPDERPRRSTWEDESPAVREALLELYGDLHRRVEAFPDLRIQ